MARNYSHDEYLGFDETVADSVFSGLEYKEQPLQRRVFWGILSIAILVSLFVILRLVILGVVWHKHYAELAVANANEETAIIARRGVITDRYGKPLVENRQAFSVFLNVAEMIKNNEESKVLDAAENILGLNRNEVETKIKAVNLEEANDIPLARDISRDQDIAIESLNISSLHIEYDYARVYPDGEVFSHVVGFVGQSDKDNLIKGRAGLEAYYDSELRGKDGVRMTPRNAKGVAQGPGMIKPPIAGKDLTTTIDADFQKYFYARMLSGLESLGRTSGVGLAMDPTSGAVIALLSFPSFDPNNIAASLNNSNNPLFNRAVSGSYNPGSTIKPLVGVAALKEGVITPDRKVFSPGYLFVPNPYNPSSPGRYLDWRYQGYVDLSSAIAQSSNVYFYLVGGGSPPQNSPLLNDPADYGIKGLGINRLYNWWQTFGLGKLTGIDLPGEVAGFLPTQDWKEKHSGTPWLLGDTYNVSIGQGDLSITPFQLLDYISAIANGGKIYRPFINAAITPTILKDLSFLLPQINEVRKGMREAVTSQLGTSYTMNDLPFPVCAKTGTAQVQSNAKENAMFVGYAPCGDKAGNPQIAILILVENAKQGSLNAVPIAKDVLSWYYNNRIMNKK
jgi:penicillin-binding protein 2